MKQYNELVRSVLKDGQYQKNRTDVDAISLFNYNYEIDLSKGYPLLTTKKMDGSRWDSMIHEFLWYLSGDEHIRNLREKTGIWDEWAGEEGHLDTAYGRFWRRYPVPDERDQLPGESWPGINNQWVTPEETADGETRLVFDQLGYVLDTLTGKNPDKDTSSRRLVVNAWHPPNAAVSTLPPCHYTFVVNVQGEELNVHLTQRSGDVALGIPFNIACYSLLAKLLAQRADLTVGSFAHTIVDAHIYCGKGERGEWYADHNPREEGQPPQDEPYDHVPGLLKQLHRKPYDRPSIDIADKPIDELTREDIELRDYQSHDPIEFAVAE